MVEKKRRTTKAKQPVDKEEAVLLSGQIELPNDPSLPMRGSTYSISKIDEEAQVDLYSGLVKPENQLTDQQELFLDFLFGEAAGDPVRAARLAGYETTERGTIRELRKLARAVSDEMAKDMKSVLRLSSMKAFGKLISVLDDPSQPGANNLIHAANSVLDRAGAIKDTTISVESNAPIAVVVLPPKNTK